jgi:hypothetical protein
VSGDLLCCFRAGTAMPDPHVQAEDEGTGAESDVGEVADEQVPVGEEVGDVSDPEPWRREQSIDNVTDRAA